MESFICEETISNAKTVSGTVSKILESMATQYHTQLRANQDIQYKVTVFDLRTVPDIKLWDYILRIMNMSKCVYRDLLAALVYVDTLINNGAIGGISFHNVHRLVALSIMISTKFFDDVHYSNASWSKIVGIPLRELNNAEMIFLQSLGYNVNIQGETLHMWSEWISRFADENPIQERDPKHITEQSAQNLSEEENQTESCDSAITL